MRRRHTKFDWDWSSDVCSSPLPSTNLTLGAQTGRGKYVSVAVKTRDVAVGAPRVRFVEGSQALYTPGSARRIGSVSEGELAGSELLTVSIACSGLEVRPPNLISTVTDRSLARDIIVCWVRRDSV